MVISQQGRNEGGKGGNNSPGAESLWGRRMTVGLLDPGAI